MIWVQVLADAKKDAQKRNSNTGGWKQLRGHMEDAHDTHEEATSHHKEVAHKLQNVSKRINADLANKHDRNSYTGYKATKRGNQKDADEDFEEELRLREENGEQEPVCGCTVS